MGPRGVNGGWPRTVTSLPFAVFVVRGSTAALGAGMREIAGRLFARTFLLGSHKIMAHTIFSLSGTTVGLVGLGCRDPWRGFSIDVSPRTL